MNLFLLKNYSNLLFKLKPFIEECLLMLIIILVKNLRKLNFNFTDVMFSPTLTIFLTTSKINIKLSNGIKFTNVGYHLPFQHNQLFHLPYMAVAEISLGRISLQVRPEKPFLLLKYIITLSLILCSYY